ncbi:MAG: hypothetical protein AB7F59_00135 [Bdellovibrionales bacterium]
MISKKIRFEVGQTVQATIERVIDQERVMANILGHFFVISNQSNEIFKAGEMISLYVESADPVRLKIAKKKDTRHIDYNV